MPGKPRKNKKSSSTTLLKKIDFINFIDSIPHGVLLLDGSQKIIAMNRVLEAYTGFDKSEVIGLRGELVLRSNIPETPNPLGPDFQSEESIIAEGDIIDQNRRKIPIRFTMSPLILDNGKNAGSFCVLEDISILKDLDKKIHGLYSDEKIIGHSSRMQEIFELLPIVARTDASALLTGETGTGKDLIAESIHKSSSRAPQPFIKVNCGALPESLLESELFGHVRGAFTGADRDKPGMFRLANNGTIFLTEIGDLPIQLQVKLLTVLDDKEFFPVGGSKKVKVDVRIIAATHRDLKDCVKQGKFREDLFYRLNVLRLHIPPLREREDDFRLLADFFLKSFSGALNKNIKGFSDNLLSTLSSYPFPGNVRELRNIIEYAVNICQENIVETSHLPPYLFSADKPDAPSINAPRESRTSNADDISSGFTLDKQDTDSNPLSWNEMEKKMIMNALMKTGGKRLEAARILGWARSTLWRKLKTHGIA